MVKIEESTIGQLQDAMQRNEITSRALVLHYLSRIASIDQCDGGLNSVLEINPDALFIADALDAMRANGTVLGKLHGIPILLKDNISTGDKMCTSAGSVALCDNYAPYDAHIARRLRAAGAVILGKANMIEFANYMSAHMPLGYSSRGGQTLNPYDKAADPSGSSTGSAVAVSANLCAAAVGTETCGSIISPAKANGIVGIKPTLGLLSRHGIIPISYTLDTPGPMARTVSDAAILLGAMAGKDENDPATGSAKQIDYTQYLDKSGLLGARIGISRMFIEEADAEHLQTMEQVITVLKENGAACVELPPHSLKAGDKYKSIMKHEFKRGMNHYLASVRNGNTPKNLQEIISYNQQHAKEALRYGQELLTDAQNNASGRATEPAYLSAMIAREETIHGFDNLFTAHGIDVIFSLAGTGLPALTGFPSMTIPVGLTKSNLPIGSFWVAQRFCEPALIRVAYAVEQVMNARQNPLP